MTGADGAASTNGRRMVARTSWTALRRRGRAPRRRASRRPRSRSRGPLRRAVGSVPRPQPPANARNQPPTARPQTPNNVNAPNGPTNSGGASGGSAPGTQDPGPPAQWAPKGQRRPGTRDAVVESPCPTVQPAPPVPVWDPPGTAQPRQSLRDRLGLRKRTQPRRSRTARPSADRKPQPAGRRATAPTAGAARRHSGHGRPARLRRRRLSRPRAGCDQAPAAPKTSRCADRSDRSCPESAGTA